jgi:hypothetical protein
MCVSAGVPVALSSDAHRPEDVGADYGRALEALDGVGVRELCVFERRVRRLAPIGAAAISGATAPSGSVQAGSRAAGRSDAGAR